MSVRDVFQQYIREDNELEQFGLWAFGSSYRELDESLTFMEAWNRLHGDKLTLKPKGQIGVDIPKMVQAWKDRIMSGPSANL